MRLNPNGSNKRQGNRTNQINPEYAKENKELNFTNDGNENPNNSRNDLDTQLHVHVYRT